MNRESPPERISLIYYGGRRKEKKKNEGRIKKIKPNWREKRRWFLIMQFELFFLELKGDFLWAHN